MMQMPESGGEPERDVIREYRGRQNRQLAGLLPVAVAVVGLFLWDGGRVAESRSTMTAVLCTGVLIGYMVYSYFNWRCPVCRGYLGRTWNPHLCPHCGTRFLR
jgi:hypothetical protein